MSKPSNSNSLKPPKPSKARKSGERSTGVSSRRVILRSSEAMRKQSNQPRNPNYAQKLAKQPKPAKLAKPSPNNSSWQNPIINYWSEKHPTWAKKRSRRLKQRPKLSKAKHLEYRILAMLAFFSISVGLWENFRQLWLQENGFSATDVGNIVGLGTIASAIALLFVGKYVKMVNIKRFTTLMLSLRCLDLLLLALINGTGWRWLIDIFSILDITSSAVIIISIYPLLTTIVKSNAVYSRRKLVEYLFPRCRHYDRWHFYWSANRRRSY